MERLPVGIIYDHGPTVETQAAQLKTYEAYQAAVAKADHRIIKPGDTIPVKGLDIKAMVSGGKHIEGKGEPNPYCAGIQPQDNEIAENGQSAGVVIQYGKFRFGDFGDLTWNKELALLCPENRVGKLDLFLTTHHGAESAKGIYGMKPRVSIMNNGARKGGTPEGWKVFKGSPGLEDLWQLHFSVAGGKEANVPDTMIANVDEPCEGKYIKVSASADGTFTVYNSRNRYSKTYPPK
jgi:hypothetical protein